MIPLTLDPNPPPYESCCLCDRPSRTWYALKDVPVCQRCAEAAEVESLPSKRDWLNRVASRHGQSLLPPDWIPAVVRAKAG